MKFTLYVQGVNLIEVRAEMQTRSGIQKQSEQPHGINKQIKNITAAKRPGVRTTELSKMIQLIHDAPDSLSKDEFMLLQNAIGYRQTVKLVEKAKLQQKLEKEKQPEKDSSLKVQYKESEGAENVQKEKEAPVLKEQLEAENKEQSTDIPGEENTTTAVQTESKEAEEDKPIAKIESSGEQQSTPLESGVEGIVGDSTEKKEASKPQPVKIKGEDPGEILEQLGKVPPTEIVNAYKEAADVSRGALEKQRHKAQEAIPEMSVPTGLAAEKKTGKKAGSRLTSIAHKQLAGFKSKKSGGKVYERMPGNISANAKSEPDPDEIMAEVRKLSAEAPKISMTGEADPSQIESFKAEASQNVKAAKQAELSQTSKDFGENKIAPEQDNTILKAGKGIREVVPPAIQIYQVPAIPPEVAARMNPSLVPTLEKYLGSRKSEYRKGREQFDSGVIAAKANTDTQIENLKTEAKEKQLNEQKAAKAEVNSLRGEWKKEVNEAAAEYDLEAGAAAEEKKREIRGIKEEKEREVKKTFKEAEKDAGKECKTAKAEAESKKKEGEKGSKNIFQKAWDWTKEKAQQALDGIKKAVSSIFNKLRQTVKNIFEKAKAFAVSVIEKGRQLVAGAIKKLGDKLKGLVSKVFARFPGISKRICGLIDRAVDKAVKAVNLAASILKKGVTAALDLMAKTVDTLFAGVQSLYNGIMNGIEKFLKSDFKTMFGKLLEGAQIAAEIAAAFATGGGSVLLQIANWLITTLPQLFRKITTVLGFVDTIRNLKLENVKQMLNPAGIGSFLVKGLFGELKGLPEEEKGEKEKEPEGGREEKGIIKVFHILTGVFKILKGVFGKVAGAINKILPIINISIKPWFDPFSMIYAGAVKALEIVKNPGEALNEGVAKLKEAAGDFFKSIKTKLADIAGSIKQKVMLLGQPAQLLKLIVNKAVDMVLNFIITHPPSALIKAVFKVVEAASGKSIIELVRQHIPFADKLINKIAESDPVQGIVKPLEQPVKAVGGMIDQVTERAVGIVGESEQKVTGIFGNGAKLLMGLAGVTMGGQGSGNKGESKKEGSGDFIGSIKGGIHTRLVSFGQKLLQMGKKLVMTGVDKVKGLIFGSKLKFKLGSENHELWVEKRGSKKVVMMASKPDKVDNILDRAKTENVKSGKDIDETKEAVRKTESEKDVQTLEPIKDGLEKVFSMGVSKVDEGINLEQRAKEIHSALDEFSQSKRTTAVGRVQNPDGTEQILVGSSQKRLSRAQREMLNPNEVEAIGDGHAEVTIINQAKANGQTVINIAASRPICPNCASTIEKIGANPASPLKKVKR